MTYIGPSPKLYRARDSFTNFERYNNKSRNIKIHSTGEGFKKVVGLIDKEEKRVSLTSEYTLISLEDANEFLASFDKIRMERTKTKVSDSYLLILRRFLGNPIREIEPVHSFGERGIQGSTKRTASIISKTHCDILEVSLKEYEDDLRFSIKDKLTSKYKLLYKHYPEASLFEAERQFEFQFGFIEKHATKGQVLIEDTQSDSSPIIMIRGECRVYKKVSYHALYNIRQSVSGVNMNQAEMPYNHELRAAYSHQIDQMRDVIYRIQEGTVFKVGYVGPGEMIGAESQVIMNGRSLFSYQVVSADAEYLVLDSSLIDQSIDLQTKIDIHYSNIQVISRRIEYMKSHNPLVSLEPNAIEKQRPPRNTQMKLLEKLREREAESAGHQRSRSGILLKNTGIGKVYEVPFLIDEKTYLTKNNLVKMFGRDVVIVDTRKKDESEQREKEVRKPVSVNKPLYLLKKQIKEITNSHYMEKTNDQLDILPSNIITKYPGLRRNQSSSEITYLKKTRSPSRSFHNKSIQIPSFINRSSHSPVPTYNSKYISKYKLRTNTSSKIIHKNSRIEVNNNISYNDDRFIDQSSLLITHHHNRFSNLITNHHK